MNNNDKRVEPRFEEEKLLQVFSADRKAFHNRCITCQVQLLILPIVLFNIPSLLLDIPWSWSISLFMF